MSLIRSLLAPTKRSVWPATLTIDDVVSQFWQFGALPYSLNQTLNQPREEIIANYGGLIASAYRSNAVVFAVEQKRLQLFSEARFQFQQVRGGRLGDLFGTPELEPLEHPEYGEVTQDLLQRILVSADFGGDAFIVRRLGGRLVVLRPDWTTMILGSREEGVDPNDVDVELIGLSYQEGGPMRGKDPVFFARGEFAHFNAIKDPLARYRGMPWLLPIIREIQGDSAATLHKLKFFENGATPNMVVTLNPALTIDKAREWIELFEQDHNGVFNAYRTVYMGGGSNAEVVGKDLAQVDFKATQGAGETRIAAAGGIHPTIAGLSEGLQGSSLNAGNFGYARRLVADGTLRPLWSNLCGALETIITPPPGSRLWIDEARIPFLADDIKDRAEVQTQEAQMLRTLTDGGWTPESVVDAVTSGDWRRLSHTGLFSVQLQPAGAEEPPALPEPAPRALLGPGPSEVRCPACHKLAGELVTAPYRFTCTNPKCRTVIEDTGTSLTVPQIDTGPLIAAFERMRPPDVTVTIEPGAVQVHSPVTIERGAVEVSNPITVEPSPVTIAEGAVRVEINAPEERSSSVMTIERDEETGVVRIGRSA